MASRKRVLYFATDMERWRVALLAEYGFYARTIARRVWGKGRADYEPTVKEIRRVYRIAKEEGIKLNDWRRGENDSSKRVLNGACRLSTTKHPKLRVVA